MTKIRLVLMAQFFCVVVRLPATIRLWSFVYVSGFVLVWLVTMIRNLMTCFVHLVAVVGLYPRCIW